MKRIKKASANESISTEEICELCKRSDNSPDKYGEKITLKQHNLTVHYFCLLTSSGVYQRGEENEGIYGFLVEDIKKEIRRSSRLKCVGCQKKGASVGCFVKSCRKMVHLPCGIEQEFIFQFTDLFPSFCRDHRPTQTMSSCPSVPLSCSVCLDPIEPVLSYSVLKCPACHGSWFHRDCVQNQAHSAALFFFKCTICNNKDLFQQEMIRMGVHIPERDASWELEEDAYGELLQVYEHCDAPTCHCHGGRNYSAQSGKFEIVRCKFCGSSATHRKCSALNLFETNWVCLDCKSAVEGTAVSSLPRYVESPLSERQENKRLIKRRLSNLALEVCKRRSVQARPAEILQDLASQISQHQSTLVVVKDDEVVEAALDLLRQSDFDPCHALSVKFVSDRRSYSAGNRRRFMRLLLQHLEKSKLFEGPDGAKNLALNSHALREDLYFEVGCLLALSLLHGGPPLGFFSKALYKCLFNYPKDYQLTVEDLGDTLFADKVKMIIEAKSLVGLKKAIKSASEYLEVAGCMRQVDSLSDKDMLVEDIVNFHLIIRTQLPLQRFREGLRTLGVFDQIQMCPETFYSMFCTPPEKMSANMMIELFTAQFSDQKEEKAKEINTAYFWRQYLHECEDGRSATSLEDVLIFATSADVVPAIGFNPAPSLSFLHPLDTTGAFPQSQPDTNQLVLPVLLSYEIFKKHLEYAVCQLTVMQAI